MSYGFIYETTNLVNGMKYIGQHKRIGNIDDPDDEWYLGSGDLLHLAIEKYGVENFTRVILCECNSNEELNVKEDYYITLVDAVKSREYYNISNGYVPRLSGEDHWLYKHYNGTLPDSMRHNLSIAQSKRWESEELRREMSEKISPTLIGNTRREGTKHSEETKKKISISNTGKTITEDHKLKLSELRSSTNTDRFKGKIYVNNGTTRKLIYPEELHSYESLGYKRGRTLG